MVERPSPPCGAFTRWVITTTQWTRPGRSVCSGSVAASVAGRRLPLSKLPWLSIIRSPSVTILAQSRVENHVLVHAPLLYSLAQHALPLHADVPEDLSGSRITSHVMGPDPVETQLLEAESEHG